VFNPIFTISFVAWAIAQTLKVFTDLLKHRRLNFSRLVGAGGMPSSHTAAVASLTTAVGQVRGWDSPELAVSLVFTLIIMYDAAGVRQAAGKQARILNQLMDHLQHGGKLVSEKEKLKELLGHTPIEVMAGAALGVAIALIMIK
jgi:acid phosphatase family membrane protein YuiD